MKSLGPVNRLETYSKDANKISSVRNNFKVFKLSIHTTLAFLPAMRVRVRGGEASPWSHRQRSTLSHRQRSIGGAFFRAR
jgi:hypothetical protein